MKKRKLSKKVTGSTNGRQWYLLIFGVELVGDTLYKEASLFVNQDIYDAVEEGQSLEIK
jgi:hypothetical protein